MKSYVSKRGFTVIELLIVSALIAILAAIFIPACMDRRHPEGLPLYHVVCYLGGTVILDRVTRSRTTVSEGVTYVDGIAVTGDCVIAK